jgi:SAM-dependent methyltransferase
MNTFDMVPKEFNPSIFQFNYIVRKRLLEAIADMAPELKGKLIDFGCGSKPYQSLFSVDEYIGVDYDNPGHSHENESVDVYYDGKTLPFPDEFLDSVFSSEVFEHVFNLQDIIKELNRVIKVGGHILITCPFAICEHEVPNDFARYSSFALNHIFTSNGFEVIKQVKTGNSIETVTQLWTTYVHLHILPIFYQYLGKSLYFAP